MRMVRYIAGMSLPERWESQYIRRMCGIHNEQLKVMESRLRYYVMRREEDEEPIKRAKNRPVIRRISLGRHRNRWMYVVRKDMGEVSTDPDAIITLRHPLLSRELFYDA
ncbi:uncharacterized protein [Palaemon carinicauda]|uniref:uncharacterized protein n=1 Tax=Palaemon carinicauda TaxID=392227 RepID=UPI0035B62882